ncbi:MAG: Ca-activated chloride channel [Acidobacteriota bacterium]|jgi:Ca-activated chloride channel family protein|nr:Ca-activated chloride channel [Acidobacteriota bacterium]
MSHEERRTARKARSLSLLILAALALLGSSCATADRSNENTANVGLTRSMHEALPGTSAAQQSVEASTDARMKSEEGEANGARGESYAKIDENPFLEAARAPLSTFSIDVDTASYSNTRRFINDGQLPPKDAVRIEELVNYFSYDYPQPAGAAPFSVTAEVADCPWNSRHRLVHIGLQGKKLSTEDLPPANLVFLIDVSGSMNEPNKLPLVKSSLRTLAAQLTARDRVAIAVYAGSSGLVLPSTPGDRMNEIVSAIERLEAGGSTNGGSGIQLVYRVAQENFIKGGTNRVILATDGDFNVGLTNDNELVRLIEEKRRGGVFLSVLGFGTGNLNDSMMEKLADKGNGNYAYIDTQAEAQKALGEQVAGTLATIAKDVKIQVEFNPRLVAGYRLIGYENRLLAERDFNDDRKDAGEIGAGHTVTALYEVVLAGQKLENPGVDELKYRQPAQETSQSAGANELLTVKLRYKEPDGDVSKPLNVGVPDSTTSFRNASENFKFAAAVAEFGMLLRDSRYKGQSSYEGAVELARASTGTDLHGYRSEFVHLVETAQSLAPRESASR